MTYTDDDEVTTTFRTIEIFRDQERHWERERIIEMLTPEILHTGRHVTTSGERFDFEHDVKCRMCEVIKKIREID